MVWLSWLLIFELLQTYTASKESIIHNQLQDAALETAVTKK